VQRLAAAVISQALKDLFCNGTAGGLAKSAREWFFSDDTDWPMSFLNCCHLAGIDFSHIRRLVDVVDPSEVKRMVRAKSGGVDRVAC
jgi:hypothetical protein